MLAPLALILALAGITATPPSAAAAITGATFAQCNGVNNGGGIYLRCDVAIINTITLDATGGLVLDVTTQTVGTCTGTLAIPCTPANITTTVAGPITTIQQCGPVIPVSGSGNGGGGGVTCHATITNNITTLAPITPAPATVNECVGSATTGTTLTCNPVSSTSGATITQCNGSGNGGGATVTCSVAAGSTTTAAMPLKIEQCNGSANGGGGTASCTSGLTNNIVFTAPTPTATATAVPATSVPATATSIPATAVPGSPNNGYRAPDYHAELTPGPAGPAAIASVPTTAPSAPPGVSPGLAGLLRKVPEATVAAVLIPPAQTPTPQVPSKLPRSGGGYGDLQRELLLAALATGGVFAMSVWLRKRRPS